MTLRCGLGLALATGLLLRTWWTTRRPWVDYSAPMMQRWRTLKRWGLH